MTLDQVVSRTERPLATTSASAPAHATASSPVSSVGTLASRAAPPRRSIMQHQPMLSTGAVHSSGSSDPQNTSSASTSSSNVRRNQTVESVQNAGTVARTGDGARVGVGISAPIGSTSNGSRTGGRIIGPTEGSVGAAPTPIQPTQKRIGGTITHERPSKRPRNSVPIDPKIHDIVDFTISDDEPESDESEIIIVEKPPGSATQRARPSQPTSVRPAGDARAIFSGHSASALEDQSEDRVVRVGNKTAGSSTLRPSATPAPNQTGTAQRTASSALQKSRVGDSTSTRAARPSDPPTTVSAHATAALPARIQPTGSTSSLSIESPTEPRVQAAKAVSTPSSSSVGPNPQSVQHRPQPANAIRPINESVRGSSASTSAASTLTSTALGADQVSTSSPDKESTQPDVPSAFGFKQTTNKTTSTVTPQSHPGSQPSHMATPSTTQPVRAANTATLSTTKTLTPIQSATPTQPAAQKPRAPNGVTASAVSKTPAQVATPIPSVAKATSTQSSVARPPATPSSSSAPTPPINTANTTVTPNHPSARPNPSPRPVPSVNASSHTKLAGLAPPASTTPRSAVSTPSYSAASNITNSNSRNTGSGSGGSSTTPASGPSQAVKSVPAPPRTSNTTVGPSKVQPVVPGGSEATAAKHVAVSAGGAGQKAHVATSPSTATAEGLMHCLARTSKADIPNGKGLTSGSAIATGTTNAATSRSSQSRTPAITSAAVATNAVQSTAASSSTKPPMRSDEPIRKLRPDGTPAVTPTVMSATSAPIARLPPTTTTTAAVANRVKSTPTASRIAPLPGTAKTSVQQPTQAVRSPHPDNSSSTAVSTLAASKQQGSPTKSISNSATVPEPTSKQPTGSSAPRTSTIPPAVTSHQALAASKQNTTSTVGRQDVRSSTANAKSSLTQRKAVPDRVGVIPTSASATLPGGEASQPGIPEGVPNMNTQNVNAQIAHKTPSKTPASGGSVGSTSRDTIQPPKSSAGNSSGNAPSPSLPPAPATKSQRHVVASSSTTPSIAAKTISTQSSSSDTRPVDSLKNTANLKSKSIVSAISAAPLSTTANSDNEQSNQRVPPLVPRGSDKGKGRASDATVISAVGQKALPRKTVVKKQPSLWGDHQDAPMLNITSHFASDMDSLDNLPKAQDRYEKLYPGNLAQPEDESSSVQDADQRRCPHFLRRNVKLGVSGRSAVRFGRTSPTHGHRTNTKLKPREWERLGSTGMDGFLKFRAEEEGNIHKARQVHVLCMLPRLKVGIMEGANKMDRNRGPPARANLCALWAGLDPEIHVPAIYDISYRKARRLPEVFTPFVGPGTPLQMSFLVGFVGTDRQCWPNASASHASRWEIQSPITLVTEDGKMVPAVDMSRVGFRNREVPGVEIAFFESLEWETMYEEPLLPLKIPLAPAKPLSNVRIKYTRTRDKEVDWTAVSKGWRCDECEDLGDFGGEAELAMHCAVIHHDEFWLEMVSRTKEGDVELVTLQKHDRQLEAPDMLVDMDISGDIAMDGNLDSRKGVAEPIMEGRKNQWTDWSHRVIPGTLADLLPELDKLWDGGSYRHVMREIEESYVWHRYEIPEKRRFMMTCLNRWRDEEGPMRWNSRAKWMRGFIDKYGPIMRRIDGEEEFFWHVDTMLARGMDVNVVKDAILYWHECSAAAEKVDQNQEDGMIISEE